MCGIAGFVQRGSRAEVAQVQAMCDQMTHRGPDDAGYYTDGGCGIGMRRLSIIDLSTGHQPIANEDGSVWIVFNGEIYNYQELRQRLIGQGHRFKTNSDTETIIHLYEEEGEKALNYLRGMFAFAIWDARKQSLFVARDRFGKKPLYYADLPEGLYFASELKCLYPTGIPMDLDEEALKLYFQFSYIPDPWSPFKQIKKLAPGGWLRYTNGKLELGRYWKMPEPAPKYVPGFDEDAGAARLRELFDESVRLRMIADVPLGAFLSGGIDSSSVVASMAMQSNEPVKTFSIGFEEADFNELEYAGAVAKHYKTDHHEIVVRPDSLELVQKIVHFQDEPFGDTATIPTFIVSEFARRHVKVVLTGDGGDELFAGYESFFAIEKQGRFDAVPGLARALVSAAADALPYSAYGKNYLRMASRPSALTRYFELNYSPYFLRRRLLEPRWMLPAEEGFLRRTFADCLLPGDQDVVRQAIYFEQTAKLTGDMLVKVDRMSMANSIEVRCPLLDHKLAEYAATIPYSANMRNGKGKQMLLKAIGDRLPAHLLNRPKMGFGFPLAHWFRGSLRPLLWDNLTSREFLDRGVVSEPFVRHLLTEHDSGRRDNSYWLWMILMFELWMRNWKRGGVKADELQTTGVF